MISIADVAPTSLERSATHLLRLSMVVIFCKRHVTGAVDARSVLVQAAAASCG
jgi:hypothetical protein